MRHIAIVKLLKHIYISLSYEKLSFHVANNTLPELFQASTFFLIIGFHLETNFICFDNGTT